MLEEAWQRGETLTAPERGAVAIAVSEARILSARAGLEVSSRLFEVAGARATTGRLNLDRFWRNLRTHSLHDPVAYKRREVGAYALLGELPEPTWYT